MDRNLYYTNSYSRSCATDPKEASLRRNSHFTSIYRELYRAQSLSLFEASDTARSVFGSRVAPEDRSFALVIVIVVQLR
jgi:hypothetical protein